MNFFKLSWSWIGLVLWGWEGVVKVSRMVIEIIFYLFYSIIVFELGNVVVLGF